MGDWHDDPDYIEFAEELMAGTDDSWDGDEAFESILLRYVQHLRSEVVRLGGCTRPWCSNADGESCDHGYTADERAVAAALRRDEDVAVWAAARYQDTPPEPDRD